MPSEPLDQLAALASDPEYQALQRYVYQQSMVAYTSLVAPWFVFEELHLVFATLVERVARGEHDRVIIEMLPRGSKSYWWSILTPSWWLGRNPSDKVMQVSYKTDLPKDFSRDIQQIVRSDEYRFAFPGVQLSRGSRAVGRWRIERIQDEQQRLYRAKQGQYFAAGVTAGIAGTGFNLGIVDDPLSEQDKDSKIAKDRVWNWWGPGFYTRRQPEKNAIIVISTRWATDDLVGRLRELGQHGGDQWEVVSIPAILDRDSAKKIYTMAKEYGSVPGVFDKPMRLKEGDSCSPRRFPVAELMRSKANMRERDWAALYMQRPSDEEGHIIKAKYWRQWPHENPPECKFIFTVYDTAFDERTANDYSACTTWGIFEYREKNSDHVSNHMIMLGRWKRRVDAPDLPKIVDALYRGTKDMDEEDAAIARKLILPATAKSTDHVQGLFPDKILIENKESGIWLIKELRRRRDVKFPVGKIPFLRSGTGREVGKLGRASYAALVFEQGAVWYMDRAWSMEVIDGCAKCKFDGSDESDDLEDTVVHAAIFTRMTYRVDLETDANEEEDAEAAYLAARRPKKQFYGAQANK